MSSRFVAAAAALSVLGVGLLAAAAPSQAAPPAHRTIRKGHVVRTVRTIRPAHHYVHHRPIRHVVVTHRVHSKHH